MTKVGTMRLCLRSFILSIKKENSFPQEIAILDENSLEKKKRNK
jgi:hypothetical protein